MDRRFGSKFPGSYGAFFGSISAHNQLFRLLDLHAERHACCSLHAVPVMIEQCGFWGMPWVAERLQRRRLAFSVEVQLPQSQMDRHDEIVYFRKHWLIHS